MSSKWFIWLPIFMISLISTAQDADNWSFKKERDGVKVYTRDIADSNLKELKITLEVNASLSSIAALLSDVPKFQEWVYRCSHSSTLEKIDDNTSYDYYHVDFPWPFSDRDLVVYSYFDQDPVTKVLTSTTEVRSDYIPKKKNLVRIENHINIWQFTPIAPNRVQIVYTLKSSPAGNIPDWMVNMALDQGPVQSMLRFRKMLKIQPYKNAHLAQILEY